MQSIHGHEVLQMMIASGEPYSTASLRRQSSPLRRRCTFSYLLGRKFKRGGAGGVSTEKGEVCCRRGGV
jgi:hypothetical protein